MNQVLEVKNRLNELSFTHIYREFNTKADQLSEEAIAMKGELLSEQ